MTVPGNERLQIIDNAGDNHFVGKIDDSNRHGKRLLVGPSGPDTKKRANKILGQTLHWRLTDDGLQWIFGVRKGNKRGKASGYRAISFCRERSSLIRDIREKFGEFPPELIRIVQELPPRHSGPIS